MNPGEGPYGDRDPLVPLQASEDPEHDLADAGVPRFSRCREGSDRLVNMANYRPRVPQSEVGSERAAVHDCRQARFDEAACERHAENVGLFPPVNDDRGQFTDDCGVVEASLFQEHRAVHASAQVGVELEEGHVVKDQKTGTGQCGGVCVAMEQGMVAHLIDVEFALACGSEEVSGCTDDRHFLGSRDDVYYVVTDDGDNIQLRGEPFQQVEAVVRDSALLGR
jgi:hypothetical protein